jgi:hypothetical protein
MCAKTKVVLSAALVLSLCGTVMANDSGENHQDGGNAVGGGGHAAFAKQSHAVNHRVKNSLTAEHEAASFDTWLPSHRGKPTPPGVRRAPNPLEKSDDFFW